MRLSNRTTVIIGAASGIGRVIAVTLARRGCHLALADLNHQGLQKTLSLSASHEVGVRLHQLDATDRAGAAALLADS